MPRVLRDAIHQWRAMSRGGETKSRPSAGPSAAPRRHYANRQACEGQLEQVKRPPCSAPGYVRSRRNTTETAQPTEESRLAPPPPRKFDGDVRGGREEWVLQACAGRMDRATIAVHTTQCDAGVAHAPPPLIAAPSQYFRDCWSACITRPLAPSIVAHPSQKARLWRTHVSDGQ